jgi:mono/diheme cytochrome c family protein
MIRPTPFKFPHGFCRLTSVVLLLVSTCGLAAAENKAEQLFVRRIAPLFHERCLACHGKDEAKLKGGFDMRTLASTRKGGDSEKPGFVAGKPEESPLFLAGTRTHADWEPMPPKEADKLSAEQIGWINEWITAGAPWPDEASAQAIAKAHEAAWSAEDGVLMKTVGGLSAEWSQRKYKPEGLWAYQRVQKPVPPNAGGNPIDAFLNAKLPAGLAVAPAADRVTLIRRATFDLIGLPPKPEEVEAFVKDSRPDATAFASVVDRLLASPHYGERMAQHWQDVTRYADSSGFANDYERGNAWRYRDYVVRSFNADKRYDQFVREQIAGDEIEPQNPEMLIATGFLRMGPWELTGMEVAKVARQRFLDDVTNGVGETFLAHSLQCARCHDHKFDPIPTHDYYSVQAVFATTQLSERAAAFLPVENTQGFEEKKYLELRRAEYLATLQGLDEMLVKNAEQWFVEKGIDPGKWHEAIAQAGTQERGGKRRDFNGVFESARNAMTKQGVAEDQFPPKLYGFRPEDYGNERVARKGLERLKWELERYEPFALAVYNGRTPQMTSVVAPLRLPQNRMEQGDLEQTCILTGGDPVWCGSQGEARRAERDRRCCTTSDSRCYRRPSPSLRWLGDKRRESAYHAGHRESHLALAF